MPGVWWEDAEDPPERMSEKILRREGHERMSPRDRSYGYGRRHAPLLQTSTQEHRGDDVKAREGIGRVMDETLHDPVRIAARRKALRARPTSSEDGETPRGNRRPTRSEGLCSGERP